MHNFSHTSFHSHNNNKTKKKHRRTIITVIHPFLHSLYIFFHFSRSFLIHNLSFSHHFTPTTTTTTKKHKNQLSLFIHNFRRIFQCITSCTFHFTPTTTKTRLTKEPLAQFHSLNSSVHSFSATLVASLAKEL